MASIEGLTSFAVAEVGAAAASAIHVTQKPIAYGTLGHYAAAPISGAIAAGAGANSEILQFQWTDSTRLAVIHRLALTGVRATTAFAAGEMDFTATIARSFTVAGTGGNTLTLTGNNQKMRSSMGTPLVGQIRVASTAALGAGTKTLDAHEIGRISTHSSAGWQGATPIIGSIYLPKLDLVPFALGAAGHPVTLAANEGIIVRATVPGTGVWIVGFEIAWAEVVAF